VAGEQVLVVDDEPTVREVVQQYLEREGYRVQVAADGPAALAAMAADAPDLIVLDLMLPGSTGSTSAGRSEPRARRRSSC
jgi:two-component system, OmpR family, response regulator ResD